MLKKSISILLALIMVFGIFTVIPFPASAAESGTTGDCTWTLDGTVLTISGNGKMEDSITSSSHPWGNSITEVIIEDGVESIGSAAFHNCAGLTNITIPSSVTNIGGAAFSKCTSLTTLTIPNTVKSVGSCLFEGCTNLNSVSISNSLTIISIGMFDGCTNLTRITIPDSVKYISTRAFWECYNLTNIVIPDSVTEIGRGAFSLCQDLTSIFIPDSVTRIGIGAFKQCHSIKEVHIPDSLTYIGSGAFEDTEWYSDLPDGLVYIGKVAYKMKGDCPADVKINEGTKSISDHAFYGCSKLNSISIPDSVISIGQEAFDGTAWYNKQPDGIVYAGRVAYKMKGTCSDEIAIEDGTLGIADVAFRSCDIKSVSLPESVTRIGIGSFAGCRNLTSVIIPDSVTCIDMAAFELCSRLTSIAIPESVTSIGEAAFVECSGLKSVEIHAAINDIEYEVFCGCCDLMSIVIPDTLNVIHESAFAACDKLTDIYYEGDEDEWNSIVIYEDNDALFNATIHYNSTGPDSDDDTFTVLGEKFRFDLSVYAKELNSLNYHPELAHLMMTMANAAYEPARAKRGYEELGMEHWIPVNYDKTGSVYGTENVCFNIGSLVDDDGTIIMLLALRGSGDITDIKQGTLDWLGNFDVDSALQVGVTPHLNFNTAANHVYEAINVYLDAIHNTSVESGTNIKYFITGHSRGGAVANLLECKLDARVGTSNVYGYNFAVPDTVKANNDVNIELFNNIFNVSNLQDPVSYVPGHIVDTMTAIPQWYATGRIDNRWHKLGRSVWFKDEDGSIDGSAHDPDRYVRFMRSRNSISAYTDTPKFHLSPTLFSIGPFLGVGYKIYATYCPVNVELVDENGKVIASVIDGVVDYHDSHFGEVIVTTEDDHKMFAVPSDKNYTLRMVGSDIGTLDYYVAETNLVSEETEVLKVYEGVALETGKEMIGKTVNVIDSDDQIFHEDKLITVGDEPMEILTDGEEVPYTFSYILGDADGSGEVDIFDATWLQRHIVDIATPYELETLLHGDVDHDGEISVFDVTYIQRRLVQIYTPYLIGAEVI